MTESSKAQILHELRELCYRVYSTNRLLEQEIQQKINVVDHIWEKDILGLTAINQEVDDNTDLARKIKYSRLGADMAIDAVLNRKKTNED